MFSNAPFRSDDDKQCRVYYKRKFVLETSHVPFIERFILELHTIDPSKPIIIRLGDDVMETIENPGKKIVFPEPLLMVNWTYSNLYVSNVKDIVYGGSLFWFESAKDETPIRLFEKFFVRRNHSLSLYVKFEDAVANYVQNIDYQGKLPKYVYDMYKQKDLL